MDIRQGDKALVAGKPQTDDDVFAYAGPRATTVVESVRAEESQTGRRTPFRICLDLLVPQVDVDADMVDVIRQVEWNAGQRRRPRGKRRVRGPRKPRRRAANFTGDKYIVNPALGIAMADDDFRSQGLWAFDTTNSNTASTLITYLESTAADGVFGQEMRVRDENLKAAERGARQGGWDMSVEPAEPTEADSTRAGVAVAVRTHLGLSWSLNPFWDASLDSRVKVVWMGSYCKGGIHLGSVYLWCSEGLSQRNLDLLQFLARILRNLHGPWLCGGDFNLTPSKLRKSGWLNLVEGTIHATGTPTCRGVEDDFFVSSKSLEPFVVGVAPVSGSGITPHSPVRIFLKGRPRSHKVRVLVKPSKAEAVLPQGCPRNQQDELLSGIFEAIGNPAIWSPELLNSSYKMWINAFEAQVADVQGLEGRARKKFMTRASGPHFTWRPAIGRPGSCRSKLSPITMAWKVMSDWLVHLLQGAASICSEPTKRRARSALWRIRYHNWEYLPPSRHTDFFRDWAKGIAAMDLSNRVLVNIQRMVAVDTYKAAERYDHCLARASWNSWLHEGPSRSSSRLHKLTRSTSGWIPTKEQAEPDDDIDEDQINFPGVVDDWIPLSGQQQVEEEAKVWAAEWRADIEQSPIRWPDKIHQERLPGLSMDTVEAAALTFPINTGLSWDNLHPRAVLRGSAQLLELLI